MYNMKHKFVGSHKINSSCCQIILYLEMFKDKMPNMSQIQTVIKITGFTGSISSKYVNMEFILPMVFSFINH